MSDTDGMEIPIIANQTEFNRAMRDILRTSDLTTDQVRKKFAEANPKADKMFERFAATQTRSLDRLAQKLDPVVRGTRQYEMVQEQLDVAVKSGAVAQDRANQLLDQARAKYLSTGAAAATAATSQKSFMAVSGQGRFILNNTTNQLSDMFVQYEMGTDIFRIMGQQLPQVAGGFAIMGGAVGIVAGLLGTVAAIGFPVAGALLTMGDNSDEAGKKIKNFADAWQEAEKAIRSARSAIDLAGSDDAEKLIDIYGEATDKVRGLVRGLADIQVQDVVSKTNTALNKLGDGLTLQEIVTSSVGDIGASIIESSQEDIDSLRREIALLEQELEHAVFDSPGRKSLLQEMREELAILEGDLANAGSLADQMVGSDAEVIRVRELIGEISQAMSSSNYASAADGISELLTLMERLGVAVDQGYSAELRRAEDLLRQAQGLMGDLEQAAIDVGNVDMSAGARELVDEIRSAHAALQDLKAEGAADLEVARLRNQHRNDPVALAGALAGREFDQRTQPMRDGLSAGEDAYLDMQRRQYVEQAEEAARLLQETRGSRRRGGGGSRREGGLFEKSKRDVEALKLQIELIGKTRSEVAELKARQELLNEARRRGMDLDERQVGSGQTLREEIAQQAEAIGKLTEQYAGASAEAEIWNQANEDLRQGLLDSILDGESFSETMGEVAKSIARARLEAALFGEEGIFTKIGAGGGLFGGGKSGSGGLFGGAIIPGILHSGGVAGSDGYSHGRSFSPSTWSGAPRYHTGGIAGLKPNEVPAILERGEIVIPKGSNLSGQGASASGGSTSLSVIIHNAPEGEHKVRQSEDGRALEITLEKAAIKAMTGPKGQRAMNTTYGIRAKAQGT